jgi:hypothetical protein
VSADGALFTGIVIVDRNRPVVMLAARQACAPRPRPPGPPVGTAPPYGGSSYGGSSYGGSSYHSPSTALQHRLFDEDEEEARRGESPPFFRR